MNLTPCRKSPHFNIHTLEKLQVLSVPKHTHPHTWIGPTAWESSHHGIPSLTRATRCLMLSPEENTDKSIWICGKVWSRQLRPNDSTRELTGAMCSTGNKALTSWYWAVTVQYTVSILLALLAYSNQSAKNHYDLTCGVADKSVIPCHLQWVFAGKQEVISIPGGSLFLLGHAQDVANRKYNKPVLNTDTNRQIAACICTVVLGPALKPYI